MSAKLLPPNPWFPDLNIFQFPRKFYRLLIWSTVQTILTISVSLYKQIHVIVHPNTPTTVCWCKLHYDTGKQGKRYITRCNIFSRMCTQTIVFFNTHHESNTLIVIVTEKTHRFTLKELCQISILQTGTLTLSRKVLRTFPVPVRNLFWNTDVYVGTMTFLHETNNFKAHAWSTSDAIIYPFYKHITVRTCASRCGHNSLTKTHLSPIPYRHGMFLFVDPLDFFHTYLKGGRSHEMGKLREIPLFR